jgi:hypothetical protein
MTSQGTAHGRFARAIRSCNLPNAEIAAREMGELSLPDALAFCLLLAEVDPPRFDRAIARWTARFILEAPPHNRRTRPCLPYLRRKAPPALRRATLPPRPCGNLPLTIASAQSPPRSAHRAVHGRAVISVRAARLERGGCNSSSTRDVLASAATSSEAHACWLSGGAIPSDDTAAVSASLSAAAP